jgi:CO/xanthine dehydrogenase Mo-binding subunit
LIRDGELSPIGHAVPHINGLETLEAAVEISGYRRPRGQHVGRGIAVAQWLPLGGECHAFVTIDADGQVTVSTAMLDQGAGTHTAMRQIVAAELQVRLQQVAIEQLDTSRVEPDTGVGASRATRIFGNACRQAALRAREQLLAAACQSLAVKKDQIILTGDGAVRTQSGKRQTYAEIVRAAGSAIKAEGFYRNFEPGPQASLCAQVAEVEVDPETGQITLKQFTTAHNTGTVINPLAHQGQIDGGVIMGMGFALMEQVMIDGGQVLATNFSDNKIPAMRDIPKLNTVVLQSPVGNGPYGGMSIGEPPVVPVAAAIANAVHDAVGVRIYDLPITAEKVLQAIKEQTTSGLSRLDLVSVAVKRST